MLKRSPALRSNSGVRGRVRNLPPPYCVLEQDTLLPESTGNTQEAVAPSRHDFKVVDSEQILIVIV